MFRFEIARIGSSPVTFESGTKIWTVIKSSSALSTSRCEVSGDNLPEFGGRPGTAQS